MKHKRNITIWSVQWVETDEAGTIIPIVEIHLTNNSAKNRVAELNNLTAEQFEECFGYPTILASDISISEHQI